MAKPNLIHGWAGTNRIPEYNVWREMRARCHRKSHKQFPDYGGRGIRVCGRWAKFVNFLADMGRRPTKQHQLERRDNEKGYSPSNCYWATPIQQARNKRNNRLTTFNGITLCTAAWAERLGIKMKTLHRRLAIGTPLDQAMKPGSIRWPRK